MLQPEIYAMLSDIFRLIIKEVTTDADKEKLAPGELGVSYEEGAFYVRNPYTGELFSPNSVEHIRQILGKFDSDTGVLNADKISNIRYYTNISQIKTVEGSALTIDTLIRQMETPSVAIVEFNDAHYVALGYPSERGILEITKLSSTNIKVNFSSTETYVGYTGKYNPYTNYFEGWVANNAASSMFSETKGAGTKISATVSGVVTDLTVITLKVTDVIDISATLSINGSSFDVIVTEDGSVLATQITANNIIMLIRDEPASRWVIINPDRSTCDASSHILNSRVAKLTSDLHELSSRVRALEPL